jgi:hypothetical protein
MSGTGPRCERREPVRSASDEGVSSHPLSRNLLTAAQPGPAAKYADRAKRVPRQATVTSRVTIPRMGQPPWNLELGVFRVGLPEDGDIGVGSLPEGRMTPEAGVVRRRRLRRLAQAGATVLFS